MENNNWNKFLKLCNFLIKILIPYIVIIVFILVIIISLIKVRFGVNLILNIIDAYLKMILTSWSATIFILGVIILLRHHDAIDYFIRNRMTGIGVDGIKGGLISSASDTELKTKTILDTKKMDEQDEKQTQLKSINKEARREKAPSILSAKYQERYKKVLEVESIIQAFLKEKYGDQYKPQVKFSSPGREDIILDGVILSHGKISAAVEIKYISSKNHDAIRFMAARMKTRLAVRGITRLILVIVGDGLTKEEAQKIQDANVNLTKRIFFYRREVSGDLHEISLES